MDENVPPLQPHVEEIVRAIEKMRAEHHSRATRLERAVDRVTALIGRPAFFGFLTLLVALWIGGNLLLLWNGRPAFDAPPFSWLQVTLTLVALYIAALILSTQRRADQLASHREQMTLQLAILSEQKSAKIIALLEELRLDSPEIKDRVDVEAQAMATPADPKAVSQAIREERPQERRDSESVG
jgi:uncharacterized membrane protein